MTEGKLTSPSYLRELMKAHGLSFNKRLGQNFLVDENILGKIIEAAGVRDSDTVLEIGPGAGTLTRELAKKAGRVVAVEIDRGLVGLLGETLGGCDNVTVIHDDALRVDFRNILPPEGTRKVIANIPYNITSPLVMKFLSMWDLEGPFFERLLLMVQAEVARRLSARPPGKDYGALTVNVAYHSEVRLVRVVPKEAFYPVPKVDSALVLLKPRPVLPADPEVFRRLVSAAFAQRRKTVANSLRNSLGSDVGDVEALLKEAGIEPGRRAEELDPGDFARLAELWGAQLANHRP